MGGQTALNLAKECSELGIWEKHNVRAFAEMSLGAQKTERSLGSLYMVLKDMSIKSC